MPAIARQVVPASEEARAFAELQRGLAPMFRRVFHDPTAPRTVVVVPSMTLDREELRKLVGAPFYEERLLCLLLLLRLPATRVVYVTSQPVSPEVVEYYLGLLPRDVQAGVRRRLTMLCCHDGSREPLTAKLLARPELLDRVRACVGDPASAHVTCFNVTPLERTLALRLGLPLYGCDPALAHLGTKSGSRDVFAEARVAMPAGHGHLRDEADMADALVALRRDDPSLARAVVKLEEGFSGEGNAIFSYDGAPDGFALGAWVRARLAGDAPGLRFVAPGETWDAYRAKFARMGGIVEAFVCTAADGAALRSPSVQCRIDPLGGIQVVSTHDQLLGGATGQVFLGCTFPAAPGGRAALHEAGRRIAGVLARKGVVGRFGVDFVVARDVDGWRTWAIEINLRKGGTTHPFLTLQHLTDGAYDTGTGQFRAADGTPCCYVGSDNVCHPAYANLDAADLLAAAKRVGLGWNASTQRGVVFHMLGALPMHGKVGVLAMGHSPADARALYDAAVAVLDRESGRRREAWSAGLADGPRAPRAGRREVSPAAPSMATTR